jgi:hypothetical protein
LQEFQALFYRAGHIAYRNLDAENRPSLVAAFGAALIAHGKNMQRRKRN